jgi:23S rRNA pseudouridine2457 synthase
MVSQFVSTHEVNLLHQLDFVFPEGTHAIGRLDQNSEGLLLLTTNKKITKLLFQGPLPHNRTYLVQVKNIVTPATVEKLAGGIEISATHGQSFRTTPCLVKKIESPPNLAEVEKPLHKNAENSWLEITLTEGRFHQVRKMVAAVNHKCIRLIRTSIEDIHIGAMQPGEVIEFNEGDFFRSLKLNNKPIDHFCAKNNNYYT